MRAVTPIGIALFVSAVIATTGYGQTNVTNVQAGPRGPVRCVQYSANSDTNANDHRGYKTWEAMLTAKAGVAFPLGTSAKLMFMDRKYSLKVMNTEDNLEKISAFLKNHGWTIVTPDMQAKERADALHASGGATSVALPQNPIERKMESIMVQEINFRKSNIRDVVEFLNLSAKQNDKDTSDPAQGGVKITLSLSETALQACPALTFNVRRISLGKAVQNVARLAGLEYDIDPNLNAVVLFDKDALVRREYPASNKVIARLTARTGSDLRRGLRQFTSLPPNAKVSYDAKTEKLIVESTPGGQRDLARGLPDLLAQLAKPPMEVQLSVTVFKISAGMAKQIQSLVPTDASKQYLWTENMEKAAQMLRQSATSQKMYMKSLRGNPGVEIKDSQKSGTRAVSVNWFAEVSPDTGGQPFVNLIVAVSIDDPQHQKNGQSSGLHFSTRLLRTGRTGVNVSSDGQYAVCLTVAKCEPGKEADAVSNALSTPAELRSWTATSGATLSARLVKCDGKVATLMNADGRMFSVQVPSLSANDIAYLESRHRSAGPAANPVQPGPSAAQQVDADPATSAIEKKLDTIIFPEVVFHEANIVDIVKYITQESRHFDKERTGVNVVLLEPGKKSNISFKYQYLSLRSLLKSVTDEAGLAMDVRADAIYLKKADN